jgi:hypothetical protein
MHKAALILLLITALVGSAAADMWYDSGGFEPQKFTPGALNGQDGWIGSAGGGGFEPMVVTKATDWTIDEQAVRLEVPDAEGAFSQMEIPVADIIAAGWKDVTVSFEIRRSCDSTWYQNLWWWWYDAGTPTYGLQWDEGGNYPGGTYPFGWNEGAGRKETVTGRYAKLEMEWNFNDLTTSSWYDGVLVDDAIPMPGDITSLTGWVIQLGHDAATGTGSDKAWIDNFYIEVVPEPAAVAPLAGFVLGLAGLLLRKKT